MCMGAQLLSECISRVQVLKPSTSTGIENRIIISIIIITTLSHRHTLMVIFMETFILATTMGKINTNECEFAQRELHSMLSACWTQTATQLVELGWKTLNTPLITEPQLRQPTQMSRSLPEASPGRPADERRRPGCKL